MINRLIEVIKGKISFQPKKAAGTKGQSKPLWRQQASNGHGSGQKKQYRKQNFKMTQHKETRGFRATNLIGFFL